MFNLELRPTIKSFVLVITVLAMGAWLFSFSNIALAGAADYDNQADCTDHDYYWYNDTCYETENAKLQAQVSSLTQKVNELLTQLQGEQEQEQEQEKWCHTFEKSLRYGDQGSEVEALHTALAKQGFNIKSSERNRSYFGRSTASAVTEFQEKYAEEILGPWNLQSGTGYVGKTTRKKLNELYGCGEQEKSITLTSPNGGEQWQTKIGETHRVTWDSTGGIDKVKVSRCMTEEFYNQNNVALLGSFPRCLTEVVDNDENHTYEGGKGRDDLIESVINRLEGIEATKNIVKVEDASDSSISDSSDDYFTITFPDCHTSDPWSWNYCSADCKCEAGMGDCDKDEDCTTGHCAYNVGGEYGQSSRMDVCEEKEEKNEAPTITKEDLPGLTASPGQDKRFDWEATDPDNDNLSWSVKWGDGTGRQQACAHPNPSNGGNWAFGAAHAWSEEGTYDIKVTVSDCKGGTDSREYKMIVKEEKSITLINPTGGETLKEGNNYKITWKSSDLPGEAKISLSLWRQGELGQQSIQIASDLPADTTEYNWKVNTEGTWAYPCFAEDTKVLMEDRSYKSIEDLEKGEYVTSYNFQEEKFKTSKVLDVVHRKDPFVAINEQLKAVPDQKIYVDGKFKKAKKIEVGDILLNKNGKEIKVHSVNQKIENKVDTYDLVLKGPQNFFAENYLVHSAPSPEEFGQVYSTLTSEQISTTSHRYRLRIFASWGSYGSDNYGEVKDVSNYFTIEPEEQEKSITVTSPNGGEQWKKGTTHDITWNAAGVQKVDIYLAEGHKTASYPSTWGYDYTKIEKGVEASSEEYNWTIPKDITKGDNFKVLVGEEGVLSNPEQPVSPGEEPDSNLVSDRSDDFFSITSPDCHTSDPWSWNYCSADCKCEAGMGDCDKDEDCTTGHCAYNVGGEYGQSSRMDVCEKTGEGQPDLVVSEASWSPEEVTVGDDVKISFVIQNKGDAGATQFDVSAVDQNGWGDRKTVKELVAGNSKKIQFLLQANDIHTTYNPHNFDVEVDDKKEVEESDESNNHYKLSFQVKKKCTDSDGGKDYYTKGKCIDGIEATEANPLWDYCYSDGETLAEMICSSEGSCYSVDYQCPNGCEDGACVELETEDCTTIPFQDADGDGCDAGTDSDCGGIEGVNDPSKTCFNDKDDDCDGMIDKKDDDLSCNLTCGDGICGWYEDEEDSSYYCPEDCEKSITVTSPNGGEEWQRGQSHSITWDSSLLKVNIYVKDYSDPQTACECQVGSYCPPCGAELIASDYTATPGRYDWKIPSDFEGGSKYKILIWDSTYPINGKDESDDYFSINQEGFTLGNIQGYKEIYSSDEKLTLTMKGTELGDGSPTSPDEGFNVQVYVTTGVSGEPVEFGENARYWNSSWHIDSAGPFEVGRHKLEVSLYCAQDNAVCADRYGKGAQVDKELWFTVEGEQASNNEMSEIETQLASLEEAISDLTKRVKEMLEE